jgi:prophage DNA circulation protein
VSALGRVPTDPDAVDAYLVRLDAVGRAMTMAQDAYAAALSERDELRGLLEGYAAKAAALGLSSSSAGDLDDLQRRTSTVLDTKPAQLERARALLAAYQAYLASVQSQRRPARPSHGGTP